METLVDPPPQQDPLEESAPRSDSPIQDPQWLDPAEADQIEAAGEALQSSQRLRRKDLPLAFAGALLLHALVIAALAATLTRLAPTRWHVQRGDTDVSMGSSAPGSGQFDDSQATAQSVIPQPPPPSPVQARERASEFSEEDSSALSDNSASGLPDPPDPMIGIGPVQSSPRLPHFASARPWLKLAAVTPAASAPQTGGRVTSPPRVAAGGGGRRGERDGLDSRGLPIPDYPAESRRRGEEGVVVVDVEVLSDGRPGRINVVSDAGHPRLAVAAIEALKLAAFEPARVDGRPVVGHIVIPYRFTME